VSRSFFVLATAASLLLGFGVDHRASLRADLHANTIRATLDLPAGFPIRIEADQGQLPREIDWVQHFTGERDERWATVAVQPDPLEPKTFGWIRLPFDLHHDEWVSWWIADPSVNAPPTPMLAVKPDGGDLVVHYGEQELLRYAVVERASDELEKDYLTRSGYFHPVRTLAGDMVTDDFSPDHPHQHGIFFAWTESRYGETKTEFWNQHLRRGAIRHSGLGPSGGGSVLAGFETKQVYRLPETDEPILEETWQARCFVVDADTWLLDLTVKQTALTDQPLAIQRYHYGGLGLRGARDWRKDLATFFTSDGNGRITGNGTRPVWSALSGPAGGRRPTLAVLDHSKNFRYPQPVRLHPDMPYFAIAPMAEGPFEVSQEKPFVARYGIVVASDAISAERLDALQRAFAADASVGADTDPQMMLLRRSRR
jgi:hypothetical protein